MYTCTDIDLHNDATRGTVRTHHNILIKLNFNLLYNFLLQYKTHYSALQYCIYVKDVPICR